MKIRLQKILSHAGVASRRLAEQLIVQGRVDVNGKSVTTLGEKADPDVDDIRVDGRRLKRAPERRHLLMYKPTGVISTRSDPERRTTVVELLSKAGVKGYFYPVGRLDYDSEGLILLTNDGEFAQHVSHPKFQMERTYEARVLGVPDARDVERLERGVSIDGRRTGPAKVRVRSVTEERSGPQALLEFVLREGRNRQVRRMCDAIGHPVAHLKRTRIGTLTLKGLKPGGIRDLTPGEIRSLFGAGSPTSKAPAYRATASKN